MRDATRGQLDSLAVRVDVLLAGGLEEVIVLFLPRTSTGEAWGRALAFRAGWRDRAGMVAGGPLSLIVREDFAKRIGIVTADRVHRLPAPFCSVTRSHCGRLLYHPRRSRHHATPEPSRRAISLMRDPVTRFQRVHRHVWPTAPRDAEREAAALSSQISALVTRATSTGIELTPDVAARIVSAPTLRAARAAIGTCWKSKFYPEASDDE